MDVVSSASELHEATPLMPPTDRMEADDLLPGGLVGGDANSFDSAGEDGNEDRDDSDAENVSAMTRVFNIPELSEAIFIELPIRNLFVIQRVCKQWSNAVKDSPKLQTALFLRPAPDPPLLKCGKSSAWAEHGDDTSSYSVLANPFAAILRGVRYDKAPFNYPEASWRRMLVSQPPVHVALFKQTYFIGATSTFYIVFNHPGISTGKRETKGSEFRALTYGDIEQVAQEEGRYHINYQVAGSSHWRTGIEYPWQVRRIVRPPPTWLPSQAERQKRLRRLH